MDSTLVVPVSTLNVPVYYVIADLEAIANEKIGGQPRDTRAAINKKGFFLP
jgi:hypothetical protein